MVRASLIFFMLVMACAPERGGGPDDTTGTAGETAGTAEPAAPTTGAEYEPCDPTHDGTDDCCCFYLDRSADTDAVQVANACGASVLCPRFSVQCSPYDNDCPLYLGGGGGPGEFTVDDETALDCALTALRDGAPGRLVWGVNEHDSRQYEETVYIRVDRVAFTHRVDVDDYQVNYSAVTEQVLAPAQKFEFCLAATELRDRIECLGGVTTGAVAATCTAAGTFDNF